MQGKEGRAEARRKGRLRFGNAAFCSGQFAGISGEEVVHRLIRRKDRYRRQNAVSVRRQENNFLGSRSFGDRLNDVFDVIDRVGNTSVFSSWCVTEIYFSGFIYDDVFQKGVFSNGVVNIRFAVFIQIDDFGITAAFVIENAFIIPAVFVVAD